MKTRLGDLLNFVGDRPISQFEWHIALIYHLNLGVIDDHQVQDTMTGQEIFQQLFHRGTEQASILLSMLFDTQAGSLEEAEVEVIPVPTKTVPQPVIIADRRAPTQPHTAYSWTPQKVIITTSAILISAIALATAIFGHRGITPEQGRIVETAVNALSDIARSQTDTRRTPPEAPQGPSEESDSETAQDATQSP